MNIPQYAETFAALGNENRLQIVSWLRDPKAHFPRQADGDLVFDGVCSGAIVRKLGISQPSVTAHMKILIGADIVAAKKIKQWTFYKLNRAKLKFIEKQLSKLSR
jgi:DNA-binding transcriptional ArsR family regulator